MQFRKQVLDNGLEIVAECDDGAHSSAVGFFVNAGSRDECDEVWGVSHFLEHMVFKGTPTRSADDVNREFDEMGAHYNAYTSEEQTVYYASVLPELQIRAVELLADIMRPSLREEDFDTEKQVIIEEILMYQDQPPFGGDDRCKELFFGDHPLARSILGTADSITALRVEQMRDYFDRQYSPANITLAASGKIDFDELVASAQRLTRNWRRFDVTRETPASSGAQAFELMHHTPSTQQYTLQMIPGPAGEDDDRFAAKVMTVILGDDSGSRMFWELIDPGKVDHVSLGHHDYQGTGAFMMYMSCQPELTAENLALIDGIYRKAQTAGIEKRELDQAKSKINSRLVLSSEKPRNRLFAVGSNWSQRNEYRSVQDDLKTVDALTIDDIQAVLAKYPLTLSTTLSVGPLEQLDEQPVETNQ